MVFTIIGLIMIAWAFFAIKDAHEIREAHLAFSVMCSQRESVLNTKIIECEETKQEYLKLISEIEKN